MALSFPLTLPSHNFRSVRLAGRSVVGVSTSILSLQQQVQEHQGQRWEAECTLPPLKRADAASWHAALLGLRGPVGTFLLGPVASAVRGTWSGTPVTGAAWSAQDGSVDLGGFSASDSGAVKAGDFFEVTDAGGTKRLHMVLEDAGSDGGGDLTVDIWPRVRSAVTISTSVVTASPRGTFRLARPVIVDDVSYLQRHGLAFGAVEALP